MELYTFRPATQADALHMKAINERCLPENYDAATWTTIVRQNPHWCFVAECTETKTLAGYVLTKQEGSFLHVLSLAVLEEHRSRGIATRLLQLILAAIIVRSEGRLLCYLEVRVSNDRAIAVYERIGFQKAQKEERYYADGEAAWKMVWSTKSLGC